MDQKMRYMALHFDHKTRLQTVIFSRISYLYKAPEKRVRKPWQNGKPPIRRRPPKRLIGYARDSTDDQVHDAQMDELRAAGCERIFQEH